MENEFRYNVIEERKAPLALTGLVDSANERLFKLQQEMNQMITKSAEEILKIMGLSPDDGWVFDMDNGRFVKIEQMPQWPPQVPTEDEPAQEVDDT